jgi:hypothetical protein
VIRHPWVVGQEPVNDPGEEVITSLIEAAGEDPLGRLDDAG